ncbi:hypothetical protein, partial [Devosia sp.]|uniref:hypothetical protein n=1 Tax=Devosia sp. TaxID=1871048 RepID=UPI002FC97D30
LVVQLGTLGVGRLPERRIARKVDLELSGFDPTMRADPGDIEPHRAAHRIRRVLHNPRVKNRGNAQNRNYHERQLPKPSEWQHRNSQLPELLDGDTPNLPS